MSSTSELRNCPVGRYHWFEVLFTDLKEQKEACRFCNKIEIYKFENDGKLVDNDKYFKDHIRAFAQPSMKVFHDIYPDAQAKFIAEEGAKKLHDEIQKEKIEQFHWQIEQDMRSDGGKSNSGAFRTKGKIL